MWNIVTYVMDGTAPFKPIGWRPNPRYNCNWRGPCGHSWRPNEATEHGPTLRGLVSLQEQEEPKEALTDGRPRRTQRSGSWLAYQDNTAQQKPAPPTPWSQPSSLRNQENMHVCVQATKSMVRAARQTSAMCLKVTSIF